MKTVADIKAAEQESGAKIDRLVELTNSIYDKLQASPVSSDADVQEVLDMIAEHNRKMDEATARDAASDASGQPTDQPTDQPTNP